MNPTDRSVRCTDPPRPRGASGFPAEELRGQAEQASAFREVVGVAAMMAVDDVLGGKRLAHAHGNRFLPDPEVRGRTHRALPVLIGEDLFGAAYAEQGFVQMDLLSGG